MLFHEYLLWTTINALLEQIHCFMNHEKVHHKYEHSSWTGASKSMNALYKQVHLKWECSSWTMAQQVWILFMKLYHRYDCLYEQVCMLDISRLIASMNASYEQVWMLIKRHCTSCSAHLNAFTELLNASYEQVWMLFKRRTAPAALHV